jgi:simple sugar transport system substrate-binding protein
VRRALLTVLSLVAFVAAGCGSVTEVRERDLDAGPGRPGVTSTPAAGVAPGGVRLTSVRIFVVTHGQASSSFWNIVRNGVEEAAQQVGATVTYRSPDTFSIRRMIQLIDEAVAERPDGLVVSLPSPDVGPAVRRAVKAGIPVVSINSGSQIFRSLGALAHVGQVEASAGRAAGERMAALGVRRAICVNHEPGNEGLDERCRAFSNAIRASGGTARVVPVDVQKRSATERRLLEAVHSGADGVLMLNVDGAKIMLDAAKKDPAAARIPIGTFDLAPEVLDAVRDGRMRFAIEQQGFLQGYLPVVMLAQQARYGLFPARGEIIPTGPQFVTKETAEQAIRLSRRGIR